MLTLDHLKALIRAADPAAAGREEAWLSSKTGASAQTINNWRGRGGVPCKNWVAVADAVKCSVDELLGRAPSSWPLKRITHAQWMALSDYERGGLEQAMLVELRAIVAESGKRPAAAA